MKNRLVELKVALVRRELSQAALARAVGLSPSQMSRILRGVSTPRRRVRKKILEVLGLTHSQLFCSHRPRSLERSPSVSSIAPVESDPP